MRFIASRLLLAARASQLFRIEQRGFTMYFHRANLAAALWVDPHHELDGFHGGHERDFFERCLRPGDVVVDVGANVGFTSLTASTLVGPRGRVYAIEPHPRIFRFLHDNIALNERQNVTLINCALGDRDGWSYLSDRRADDRNSVVARGILEVPIRRLDNLELGRAPIRLLKIDVEGYERFVLDGARRVLNRVELVYFESIEEHYHSFGYTLRDVLELLTEHGFSTYVVARAGELEPVAHDHTSRHYENLVAVNERFRSRVPEATNVAAWPC